LFCHSTGCVLEIEAEAQVDERVVEKKEIRTPPKIF
jgi:hypothetical protein